MVIDLHARKRTQKLAQVRESRQNSVWDGPVDYIVDVDGLERIVAGSKKRKAKVLEFKR